MQKFIITKLKTTQDKLLELAQRNRKPNSAVHKIPVTFADLGTKLGYEHKVPVKIAHAYDEWSSILGDFKPNKHQQAVLNSLRENLKGKVEFQHTAKSTNRGFSLYYYRLLVQEVMFLVAVGVYPSPYIIAATKNLPADFLARVHHEMPRAITMAIISDVFTDESGQQKLKLERKGEAKTRDNK